MYAPGQIVYDCDARRPVKIGDNLWDAGSYPKRHVHFIKSTPKRSGEHAQGGLFYELYEIAMPRTLKEARELLKKGIIQPAPTGEFDEHCWMCHNWHSNCAAFRKCSEWEHSLELRGSRNL